MIKLDKSLPIKVIARKISDVSVNDSDLAYKKIVDLAKQYYESYKEISIGDIPDIQNARKFFRAIGIDPTKRRPSSEALLRRAMKQKDLYHINNLVDVANWCSLEFLLPICVYDADKIIGDTLIKIGSKEDKYLAINNREICWDNKFVICDEKGAYGSPITDSIRTSVTKETKNTMLIIFAPEDYSEDKLHSQMALFEERVNTYCR